MVQEQRGESASLWAVAESRLRRRSAVYPLKTTLAGHLERPESASQVLLTGDVGHAHPSKAYGTAALFASAARRRHAILAGLAAEASCAVLFARCARTGCSGAHATRARTAVALAAV